MAGKPHAEARESFAGRRPLLQGPLPKDWVVRDVQIPRWWYPKACTVS